MVILDCMKVAVSLPDQLFQRADALAGRLGVSRSRLYADALAEYMENHASDGVTEALDTLYRDEPATLDHDLAEAQAAAVDDEDW
jgi:metal-responsive CopG/Arc/MetJ family transcriptional regulator